MEYFYSMSNNLSESLEEEIKNGLQNKIYL